MEEGNLGEENTSFQLDESVLNSSDKHLAIDLRDNRTLVMKKKGYKKQDNEKDACLKIKSTMEMWLEMVLKFSGK